MNNEDKNYCVLIDGDNISPKVIPDVFKELTKYGKTPIRKLYGDFSIESNKSWKDVCLTYSIKQEQAFNYSTKKNSTDIAMTIDAMSLLYTKSDIHGFVIVSSDADFTGLAQKIREECKDIIGMGENKTPEPLRRACNIFTLLENIKEDKNDTIVDENKDMDNKIKDMIKNIINSSPDKILVSQVKDRILKENPDFDERTYGYRQFSKMLEEYGFKLEKGDDNTTVYINNNTSKTKEFEKAHNYILEVLNKSKSHKINIGELNKMLHKKGINYEDFGYSKPIKFLKAFPELVFEKTNVSLKKS